MHFALLHHPQAVHRVCLRLKFAARVSIFGAQAQFESVEKVADIRPTKAFRVKKASNPDGIT